MLRLRSRPVLLLSAFAILPVAGGCGGGGSDGGGASTKSTKPLRFSAVRDVTPGHCPSGSTSTIEDKNAKTCLHLGKPTMTVASVKSAEATSEPQWSVVIRLGAGDSRRLEALTTTVSKRSTPQNQVALVLGSPTDGRLLSAPTVQEPISGDAMQVSGGLTKKSAADLVHDLGS